MKNKIFTTILLAIIIIFSIQLSAQAVIVSTDKQVESGSGTVTISVTSKQLLGAYTLKLTDTVGLTLVGASGGEVSADKKTITGSAAEGTTSLGTYTFNVPTVDKDTTYNIKFSITGMETPSLEIVPNETNTAVLTVKAPIVVKPEPEPQPQPQPQPDPKPETPITKELEFTSVANKTMYIETNTNFRSEYKINTSNIIAKLSAGTEVTQVGISKTQSEGYTWSKIIYNGQTGYVINGNLTSTKPEEPVEEPKNEEPKEETPVNKPTPVDTTNETTEAKDGIKSLEIEGISLSPKFSPNVYEYRIIVKQDINELKINAVPTLEDATITIAGNTNLKEGENLITIVVYNADNQVATYQITANKNTLDLTDTDNLLKSGTQSAKRNLIIFIIILAVAIVALGVVTILKRKNEDEYEEDYELNTEEDLEFTENKRFVENQEEKSIQNEITEDEAQQIETRRPRREKRKGKHF